MTVSNTANREIKAGNGVTTLFPINIQFDTAASLVVTLVDTLGVENQKTLTTDYTVAGGSGSSGSVTVTSFIPATGETLVIERIDTFNQGVDYGQNDSFPAEVAETGLDKLTRLAQQVNDGVSRALRLPITDDPDNPTDTVLPALEASKFLGVDAGGTSLQWLTPATSTLSVSAFGQTLIDDANASTARQTLGLFGGSSELTIVGGSITPSTLHHTVDTESDAATDQLDTIDATGVPEGTVIWLKSANIARRVYCTRAGNLNEPVLLSSLIYTPFKLSGSTWYVANRGTWLTLDEKDADNTGTDLDLTGAGLPFRHCRILLTDIRHATDGGDINVRVFVGGTIQTGAGLYSHHTRITDTDTAATAPGGNSISANLMSFATDLSNAGNEALNGTIEFFSPGGTDNEKLFYSNLLYVNSDVTASENRQYGHGAFLSANAIDGVRVFSPSGNLFAGKAELQGFAA